MAANDLLTLAEGKRAVHVAVGDSTVDDELAIYITAASTLLDEHIGPTVARTVTSETHNGVNDAGTAYRRVIILRHRPVMAFTSLAVDGTTLTQSSDYHAEPYTPDTSLFSGVLRRRFGSTWGVWEYGTENIVCSYTAGRVASTTSVPSRIKRACGIVLENLWRDREPSVEDLGGEFVVPRQSFPTFAMPRAAAGLLVREMGFAETFGIGGG